MEFKDFNDLVDKVNRDIGLEFCKKFQYKRKHLTGSGKAAGVSAIFGNIKDDWAINEGGGIEIQYHIGFPEGDYLVYGLGFNTQYVPFANKKSPVDYMKPFMQAFLKIESKIKEKLPGYVFIYGDRNSLVKPENDKYTLFGRKIAVSEVSGEYNIDDAEYKLMIEDFKKQYDPYVEVFELKNIIEMTDKEVLTVKDLLKYKKQIILQGPPGTGKTRLAKLIGLSLTKDYFFEKINVAEYIKEGMDIDLITNYNTFHINQVIDNKIKVQPKGSKYEFVVNFSDIHKWFREEGWNKKVSDFDGSGTGSYITAISNYIKERFENPYVKIIQFHPSFSYEDFVRGISAKATSVGISYKAEDRILAKIANEAYQNYLNSKKRPEQLSKEVWVNKQFQEVNKKLQAEFALSEKYHITPKVYIYQIDDDCLRYKGVDWSSTGRINFNDLKALILANISKSIDEIEIKDTDSVHAWYRQSYYMPLLKYFYENSERFVEPKNSIEEPLKNYILIIDEINRANLPSVLGELIYALEYRGESIESMYEIEEKGNKIIIPPNLYIIGTMNTADRSVGHIDYAIRRRFSFVDVLPTKDPIKDFALPLFKKISELFVKSYDTINWDNSNFERSDYLAPDFRPEDVWVGHSYFITKEEGDKGKDELEIKLKYEIKPILKEYLKDGILLESARKIVEGLNVTIS